MRMVNFVAGPIDMQAGSRVCAQCKVGTSSCSNVSFDLPVTLEDTTVAEEHHDERNEHAECDVENCVGMCRTETGRSVEKERTMLKRRLIWDDLH